MPPGVHAAGAASPPEASPKKPHHKHHTMKKLLITLGLAAMTVAGANAQIVPVAGWDFDPLPGGSGNFGPTPYAPGTTVSNVTYVGLTRNWSLGTGSGAANAWGGNNFNTVSPSFASALSNNNFVTFSLTPDVGYKISLDSFDTYNIRRSSSGPTTGRWQYQIGAGSFVDIGSDITWGGTTTSSGNTQATIDLSSIVSLQDVTDTVTFRVVTWGATTSGGTWYFNDPSGSVGNDLVLNGSVALVPEPGTWLLIGLGSAVILARMRRKSA